MKMLVVFEKTGPHRFLGHLDLQRAMQRALRRSGLPVTYSQGFNPHLQLSFAAPLSVGIAGLREVMEVPLAASITPATFVRRLNDTLPEGMKAQAAVLQEDSVQKAMARMAAATYILKPETDFDRLAAAVPGFLARESIPFMKKGKAGEREENLRPLIYNLMVKEDHLMAVLATSSQGTARADQLLSSLCEYAGVDLPRCDITRTALLDDSFVPLEGA